jgi:hypothetical protein
MMLCFLSCSTPRWLSRMFSNQIGVVLIYARTVVEKLNRGAEVR